MRRKIRSSHARVIIADDLTGACDAGVQFAKQGMPTKVLFKEPSRQDLIVSRASMLVYDAETRNKSPKTAYRSMRRFSFLCKRAGVEIVYKKIDSTMRGNLGAELDGLLDAFRRLMVVVSPTYPAYQRTLVKGRLLIRGRPVDETEFAHDPLTPVRSSDAKTLISLQTTKPVSIILLPTVRHGSASIARTIRGLVAKGIRICCVDAENGADLKSIARACIQTGSLPCGSAGLGEEVASSVQATRSNVMVLSASTNSATMNELRRLIKEPRISLVMAGAAALIGKTSRKHEVDRIHRMTQKALTSHEVVLVCSALHKGDLQPILVTRPPSDPIAGGLAAATCPLVLSGCVNAVLVTGGEMAVALLKGIRAGGLRIETELLSGIAGCTVISGPAAGLRVVTKAGGFGAPGSVTRLVRYLRSTPW